MNAFDKKKIGYFVSEQTLGSNSQMYIENGLRWF